MTTNDSKAVPLVSGKLAKVCALLLCLEAALVIRVMRPWTSGDSQVYFDLSRGFLRGHFGRFVDGGWIPEGLRPPGYPLFLLVLHEILHLPAVVVVAIQVSLTLAAVLLLQRIVPERLRGWPLYALVILYPAVLNYATLLMAESVSIFIVAVLLVVMSTDPLTTRRAALVGVICGIGVLTRPNLVTVPLVPILAWATTRTAQGRLLTAERLAAIVGAFAITVSPMVVFNMVHSGRPTPLAVPGSIGTSLYLASWEDIVEFPDVRALYFGVATPRARESGLASSVERLNGDIGVAPLTAPWSLENYPPRLWPIASARIKQEALSHIRQEPAHYLARSVRATWGLWVSAQGAGRFGRLGSLLSQGLGSFLWLGGVLGALLSLKRDAPLPHRAAGFLVLSVLATQSWLHLEGRFTAHARLPLAVCFLWFVHTVLYAKNRQRSAVRAPAEPGSEAVI